MSNEDRFYVYTYTSSLSGLVFYVGKGTNDRCIQHVKDALAYGLELLICHSHRKPKRKLTPVMFAVRGIWEKGGKVIIRKVHKQLGNTSALVLEQKLIERYGYEQLVNRPYRNKYMKSLPYYKSVT